MNEQIMSHPDFYLTPCAAIYYYNDQVRKCRPWVVDADGWKKGSSKIAFAESRLHPVFEESIEALAYDLVARCGQDPLRVTLAAVIDWWLRSESHLVFEGHLPAIVPFAYVQVSTMNEKRSHVRLTFGASERNSH